LKTKKTTKPKRAQKRAPVKKGVKMLSYTEANDSSLGKPRVVEQHEIGNPGPIEKVAESDFVKAAEMESFMHEELTIMVHPSQEDGALDFAPPQVNGLNQPILRGVNSKIKRKYVEALARCRTTKYVQRVIDTNRPENIQMVESCSLSYPFAVIEDRNPRGRAWLEAILSSP
jgi:hypothetical protein